MAQLLYLELSRKVLGAYFAVHNVLGPGLLESAYEGALVTELKQRSLTCDRQVSTRSTTGVRWRGRKWWTWW